MHLLTQVPAELFGLRDRGTLSEGAHADMVLFDPLLIESEMLTMVDDLPGGTSRLYAGSVGVNHVFVSGVEVVRNSEATGELPGSIIRSGVDTDTVALN
ncbi:unannotated protein [freshwater metagenome]|uniref:Unannotated protein n=1 Tax=freshwater metagenome TaxID=449393 RepID=A0A6J6XC48_9ZZZZ